MNEWFDAEQRVERAQQLCESRRWEEALTELDAALEVNPDNATWLVNRGFLLDQLERFEEAAASYDAALRIEPGDRDTAICLAIDLSRSERVTSALTVLTRLAEQYPDFEPAYCYQIAAYTELGQHDKAEEAFYLARQIREDCPYCFDHMGMSLAHRGEFKRALYCWERALQIDPILDSVRGQMARAYRAMGDRARATEYYLSALREDPGDVDLLHEMGVHFAEIGEWESASRKFRQVIELDPDHVDAHVALADLLLRTDDVSGVIYLLECVRTLDPDHPRLDQRFGVAYLKAGKLNEALLHLERTVEASPTNKSALLLCGNCLLLMHRPEAAADRFRRVIALDATLPNAFHNLGVCCFLRGEIEQGIEHCRRAIELKPDYYAAIVKTARAYIGLGRFSEARDMIEYGLRGNPDHALLRQMLEGLFRARVKYFFGRFAGLFRRLPGGAMKLHS